MTQTSTILALDVGERRIGVARASAVAKLPSPLKTIHNEPEVLSEISNLIKEQNAIALVLGLPRGLNGQETKQTEIVNKFAERLKKNIKIPIYFQDEALTSKQAETELQNRQVSYNKGAIDELAAVYILNDFLAEHKELSDL